jgi:hypothetical protein
VFHLWIDSGPGTLGQAAPTLWRAPVITTRMEGGKDDVMMMTNYAQMNYLRPMRTPATPPGPLPLPTSAKDRTHHARLPQYIYPLPKCEPPGSPNGWSLALAVGKYS